MDSELIAYLDRRFDAVEQRFEAMEQRFEAMEQRFEAIEQRFDAIETRLANVEDAVRHTNVLVEGLRGEVHLIAEGFIGLSDKMDKFQAEATLVFDQVKGWIEPYYRNLDIRLKVMEGQVERRQVDILDQVRQMLGRPPLRAVPTAD